MLSHHVRPLAAKNPLGGWIEDRNRPGAVHRQNAVVGSFEQFPFPFGQLPIVTIDFMRDPAGFNESEIPVFFIDHRDNIGIIRCVDAIHPCRDGQRLYLVNHVGYTAFRIRFRRRQKHFFQTQNPYE